MLTTSNKVTDAGAARKPTKLASKVELCGEFCFLEVKTGLECGREVVDVAKIRFVLVVLLI